LKLNESAKILIGVAGGFLAVLIIKDLFFGDSRKYSKFVSSINRAEENYFNRLGNLDRKRWIAEEHYRRKHLNLKTLSDESFSALCQTPGRKFNFIRDPYNYDILVNEVHAN